MKAMFLYGKYNYYNHRHTIPNTIKQLNVCILYALSKHMSGILFKTVLSSQHYTFNIYRQYLSFSRYRDERVTQNENIQLGKVWLNAS